jgi:hypothetical protein
MTRCQLTREIETLALGKVVVRAVMPEGRLIRLSVWTALPREGRGRYWVVTHSATLFGPRYPGLDWYGRVGSEFSDPNPRRWAAAYEAMRIAFPRVDFVTFHRGVAGAEAE